jgi:outer membrane lipoprotein carrier protein
VQAILRKHYHFAWLMAAVLAIGGNDLMAQQPAREQLERFTHDLETFSAKFEQRVLGRDGSVEDESAGTVWLSQPHFIRWEYGGDFPELVVADGQHIWIYDEVLEQVTVKPQSDFVADSPLSLLTDISGLDEQFEVREAGDMDGMALLELRSIDAEAEFERVLLGFQQDELRLMTMEDAFGLRTEIRFSEPQRNLELSLKLFSFSPPEGVDIIGNLEAEPSTP